MGVTGAHLLRGRCSRPLSLPGGASCLSPNDWQGVVDKRQSTASGAGRLFCLSWVTVGTGVTQLLARLRASVVGRKLRPPGADQQVGSPDRAGLWSPAPVPDSWGDPLGCSAELPSDQHASEPCKVTGVHSSCPGCGESFITSEDRGWQGPWRSGGLLLVLGTRLF